MNQRDEHSSLTVTPACLEDIEAVLAITREAFRGMCIDHATQELLGPLDGQSWQDIKAEYVRREFEAAPKDCFVARLADKVVGYVTTRALVPGKRGWIPNLAVAAQCRGKGIGRKLLERALAHFREQGFSQVRIETLATNPVGAHLYPALGFREVVRQVHYVMKL